MAEFMRKNPVIENIEVKAIAIIFEKKPSLVALNHHLQWFEALNQLVKVLQRTFGHVKFTG